MDEVRTIRDVCWVTRKFWRRRFAGNSFLPWRGSEPRFRPDPFGSLLYATSAEEEWDTLGKRKDWAGNAVVRRYWRWSDSQEDGQ